MSNTPIARVEDHSRPSSQLLWHRQRRKTRRECHGGRVALEADPFLWNTNIGQSSRLIQAQYLKCIDTATPEVGETEQALQEKSAASTLCNETLRMEIHDAVDQPFPQQHVQWRDEMQQEWRTACK